MIYPEFIKNQETIGVTAPSDGITKKLDIKRLENGIKTLNKKGFKVIETDNVRKSILGRSSSKEERTNQLETLFQNKEVKVIISAAGGDFLNEIIPCLNYNIIKNNPKWIQGYSDNTWLTYTITTKLDIATIYSNNFKAFGMCPLHKSLEDNIKMLKGMINVQKSFNKYEKEIIKPETGLEPYNLTEKVKYNILTKEKKVDIKGRIIGGCLDVIKEIIGSKYDETKKFIRKYKEDGIIWYFETYSLTSEEITRTLWNLKDKGYFCNAKAIIFGRELFYKSDYNLTFEETIYKELKELNIPIITQTDIGHVSPRLTIINGAIANIKIYNQKGEISFILK